MTPNEVNLLVAMAKALEDLLAGARDKRSALAMFRRRVEADVEREKTKYAEWNGTAAAADFYDVPQADLDACDGVYVRGVVRTPGWSEGE